VFTSCGMTVNDAISLSFAIPSCFDIHLENFQNVIMCLQRYGLCAEKLLSQHPYLGAFDHNRLEENLKSMTNANLTDTVSKLIHEHPILLLYPLTETAIKVIEKGSEHTITADLELPLRNSGVENKSVAQMLMKKEQPFEIAENVQEFFANYNINTEELYRVCPELLLSDRETLEKSLECVLSEPFYCEEEDVQMLIANHPYVFLHFHSDEVAEQVQYIERALPAHTKANMYKFLIKNAEIFREPETFFQRVALFKRFDFTDLEVGKLLITRKGSTKCFIDCGDYSEEALVQLLNLYFPDASKKKKKKKEDEVRDIETIQVVYSSPICLSSRFYETIRPRLLFIRHLGKVQEISTTRKPKKDQPTLARVIRSDVKGFVEYFGSTIEEFAEFSKHL